MTGRSWVGWGLCVLLLAPGALAAEASVPDVTVRDVGPLVLLPPHVGVRWGHGKPAWVLGLVWSMQLGPVADRSETASVLGGRTLVHERKRYRLLVEPHLAWSRDRGTAFGVRTGFRAVEHLQSLPVGLGAGMGLDVDLGRGEVRASPEAVLYLGRCCGPPFVTVAARREFAVQGANTWQLTVGTVFF